MNPRELMPNVICAGLVCAVSLLLELFNRAAQRAQLRVRIDEDERRYRERQHKRRSATNAMIGLVGVAILLSILITHQLALLVYWSLLAVAVMTICGYALMDALATKRYFLAKRRKISHDRTTLAAEAKVLRETHSEGESGRS